MGHLKLHVHSVLETELKFWAHVERPMVISASDFESEKVAIAEPCSTLLATWSEACAAGPCSHACLPPDRPSKVAPKCAGSQLAGLMQSGAVHPKRPSASQHSNSTTQTFAVLDPCWGSQSDASLRSRGLAKQMGLPMTSEEAQQKEAAREAQRRLLRLQSVTRLASARSVAQSRRHRTRSEQERKAAQDAARRKSEAAAQALAAAAYAAARANVRMCAKSQCRCQQK